MKLFNSQYLCCLSMLLLTVGTYAQNMTNLLVGTYTDKCESRGIYVYDFDLDNGYGQLKSNTARVINPSYLAVAPNGKFVYSVNENGAESQISSFSFIPASGKLEPLNTQPSEGDDPCHIISDQKHVISANYSGGTLTVFKIGKDGSLNSTPQIITHSGRSSNAQRQEAPHPHMVQFSPDHQFVFAADLGTDHLYVYNYDKDATEEILTLADSIKVKTGSGPRHFAFSPSGSFLYLLHELTGEITTYTFEVGKMKMVGVTSVVEKDFDGQTSAAAIKVSPDGKFVYATNRGDANTISTFSAESDGKLKLVSTISSGGVGPRDMVIDPSGKYILVAHQKTNDIVIYIRNAETGELEDSNNRIEVCSPVCLVFASE